MLDEPTVEGRQGMNGRSPRGQRRILIFFKLFKIILKDISKDSSLTKDYRARHGRIILSLPCPLGSWHHFSDFSLYWGKIVAPSSWVVKADGRTMSSASELHRLGSAWKQRRSGNVDCQQKAQLLQPSARLSFILAGGSRQKVSSYFCKGERRG